MHDEPLSAIPLFRLMRQTLAQGGGVKGWARLFQDESLVALKTTHPAEGWSSLPHPTTIATLGSLEEDRWLRLKPVADGQ